MKISRQGITYLPGISKQSPLVIQKLGYSVILPSLGGMHVKKLGILVLFHPESLACHIEFYSSPLYAHLNLYFGASQDEIIIHWFYSSLHNESGSSTLLALVCKATVSAAYHYQEVH